MTLSKITHIYMKSLATANEIIGANRANKFAGASIKKKETMRVVKILKDTENFEDDDYPLYLFVICELRRSNCDFDNAWTSVKPMLDGCVKKGLISNDSLTYIGTPAIIEYIKVKTKATHLILSTDIEEGRKYQKQVIETIKKENLDNGESLSYNQETTKQFKTN